MTKKIFKTHLSKYFILSWVLISLTICVIVFLVFAKLYKQAASNTQYELTTIAKQSAFAVETYVRLLHTAESSLKDSIEENFYTNRIPIITKNLINQDNNIYAILIVSFDKQVIFAYPQSLVFNILSQNLMCNKDKISISSAFNAGGKLMVADCIPFSKGYIVVARVPILMLVKPLINVGYKTLNVLILKKDGMIQDSLKEIKLTDYKSYVQKAQKSSGHFDTTLDIVSYAKIPYTQRTLFVSVSKKEIYENYLKDLLPFFLIMLVSFFIFSVILFWSFYKLNYFEKLKQLNAAFVKTSNDINALMIDNMSFRSLLDKISQKLIENSYIDLCIFYFKEKSEMKIKSYTTKKECLECFKSKILTDGSCNKFFLDLAQNTIQPRIINVKGSMIHKLCPIKFVGVFPIFLDGKVIGALITASNNEHILDSSEVFEIFVHFLDNFKNKLKLIKLEKLQASSKNKAQYLAYHDKLTGLANRSFFIERFNQAIAKSRRKKAGLALFSMDLDGFKAINDTFGHDMGDKLLKAVGKRLKSIVRQEDTIARFGGDEFLLFTDSFENKDELQELANRILNAIKKPFNIDNLSMSVGISIGIAYILGNTSFSEVDFLKKADELLYKSKNTGRNKYTISEV